MSLEHTPFPQCPESKLTLEEVRLEEEHFYRIIRAFSSFASNHKELLKKHWRDYEALSERHRSLIPEYKEKLQKAEEYMLRNQQFYDAVIAPHKDSIRHEGCQKSLASQVGADSFSIDSSMILLTQTENENLRSLLRQVMRDWSEEGDQERRATFDFFYSELEKKFPDDRQNISILVPGAGLGRLAYEISQRGFKCQGNEFSLFMLLTAEMFLTRHFEPKTLEVFPFILPFSNTVALLDPFKPIKVPDIAVQGSLSDFSMVAGDFLEVYAGHYQEWDAIATCYFIDTAQNIVRYIEMIYDLLVPGGIWINSGPLLYHFEGHAKEPSIELSIEEIRLLCERIGFIIEHENTGESTYAQNSRSMHQTIYRTWSFCARKLEQN